MLTGRVEIDRITRLIWNDGIVYLYGICLLSSAVLFKHRCSLFGPYRCCHVQTDWKHVNYMTSITIPASERDASNGYRCWSITTTIYKSRSHRTNLYDMWKSARLKNAYRARAVRESVFTRENTWMILSADKTTRKRDVRRVRCWMRF